MNKNPSDFIKKNWSSLKDKIHSNWEKLSENDLNEIAEFPEKLIEKIKKAYNIETNKIEEAVNSFLSKNGFESSFIEDFQDNAETIKNNLTNYVEKHPIKSLGIAVLGGLILAKLIF
jgi:ElaB/YqjD/DUF883 family membrane-anchored ribosome-binding protein